MNEDDVETSMMPPKGCLRPEGTSEEDQHGPWVNVKFDGGSIMAWVYGELLNDPSEDGFVLIHLSPGLNDETPATVTIPMDKVHIMWNHEPNSWRVERADEVQSDQMALGFPLRPKE